MTKFLVLLFAATVTLAACGDGDGGETGDTAVADVATTVAADLPINDDDDAATSGLASGACLAGADDCQDTGGDIGAEPLPLPGDDDAAVDGQPIEGVTGFLHIDSSGVRLCGVQLESFPVQCGDELAIVEGLDVDNLGEWIDLDDTAVTSAEGVTWTAQPVTLFGTLVDGVLNLG